MDRFIESDFHCEYAIDMIFKIQYGQIYRLTISVTALLLSHLKSNMDRFIDLMQCFILLQCVHLKSNMDRFIDLPILLSI